MATITATLTPVPTSATFYEPNDSCWQANAISPNGLQQVHLFESVADIDWAFFDVVAGEQYLVEARGVDTEALDISLRLFDECDSALTPIENPSFSPFVRYQIAAPSTGRIYVRLQNDSIEARERERAGVTENPSYRLSVRHLNATPQRGLLILVAGRLRIGDELQTNIEAVAQNVYTLFRERGYEDDDIYFISARPLADRDAAADVNEFYKAITTWAVEQGAGVERPLTLYLVDHGDEDVFYLDGVRGQLVTPVDLDSWLTELETIRPGIRINVFYEACFSGSFIQNPNSISKPGRVIITSTSGQNLAYASRGGAVFSDLFITGLRQGSSLLTSFQNAAEPITRNFLVQRPWLDDNGNGIPNDPGDGQEAARRGFNFAGTLDNGGVPQYIEQWPPYISAVRLTELAALADAVDVPSEVDSKVRRIWAKVLIDEKYGDRVKDVWVEIFPPSFVPPENSTEMVRSPMAPCSLIARGNNEYEAQCSPFDEVGTYQVIFYALSNNGLLGQPKTLNISVGFQIFLPAVER